MTRYSKPETKSRNGHTLVVGIVARISGCASQKEVSLDDQVDHAKEEIADIYDGPVDFRIIATKGKGECIDRPELAEIESMIRSRELDAIVMEDVGRMVRGAEAVRLWGLAVDHGTRCIAPNDCCDTADETWEEDLISACRDHVGHNAHTSKRLKKKLMNRFKKFGGSVALPIAGFVKPADAKTYADWRKDDRATETIVAGLEMLKDSQNCSAVADFFNQEGFATGPYCKRDTWDGTMVRRYYGNRLLGGHPGRGFRRTVKRHETGRRVSTKNTESEPMYFDCPHLAHVDIAELDEVNAALKAKNANYRRKPKNGLDPHHQRPRKRTRFPGQHALCWYCGRQYVWGGNGITNNLMCSGAREWRCWNSFGFNGQLAAQRVSEAILTELYELDGFDDQFRELVREAGNDLCQSTVKTEDRVRRAEEAIASEKENLVAAIAEYGPGPMIDERLRLIDEKELQLAREKSQLRCLTHKELKLPQSVTELRRELEGSFERLTLDSPEFGDLLRQVVPEFHVFLVRLCDGGVPVPRARIEIDLSGSVPDMGRVPELRALLTRRLTLDLFDRAAQREAYRQQIVSLRASELTEVEVAKTVGIAHTTVQRAAALERRMNRMGISDPYVIMHEPPSDHNKLRRHKNPKYRFERIEGYEQPSL